MIEISITGAFIVYSFVLAIVAVILWYLSEINVRKIYTAFKEQNVWRCDYCAFVYLDTVAEEVSQCPRCYSYNVAKVKQKEEVTQRETLPEDEKEKRRNPSHKKNPHARHRGPRRRR